MVSSNREAEPPAMTLLVVDDHQQFREVAVRLLACLGHEAFEAPTAAAAEEVLSRHGDQIDIVMMDLHLGDTDGVALARRLVEIRPRLGVLFMSGHGDEVLGSAELAGPRRLVIGKPFSIDALDQALCTLRERL
jgi:two-component system, cell cycle sensor histidine kinase and response regulator CckA